MSDRDHDTQDSPNPARLDEAFKGLRDLNRREHDWLARDIADLQRDFMALRERIAEAEPRLADVVRLQAQTTRAHERREVQWPQWVLALMSVAAVLVALWSAQHPAPPPTDALVAAIEAYETAHPRPAR